MRNQKREPAVGAGGGGSGRLKGMGGGFGHVAFGNIQKGGGKLGCLGIFIMALGFKPVTA